MPRKRKVMRNPNHYGSIKKLSGNRRCPYMVCVNPKINAKGSYSYDILGYYAERSEAMIALAEYNQSPIDLSNKHITFEQVYEAYYKDKYESSKKNFSKAAQNSTRAAFRNCSVLHSKPFVSLRHSDLQLVIDTCPLKHASLELIVNLFHQMYAFAMREDIVQKDASLYIKINIAEDDEHGIRFAEEDIRLLWQHTEIDYVKIILIYLYTGWRARELLQMPKTQIDLQQMTMQGGNKTAAGKQRILPIHSRIQAFVKEFYEKKGKYLFTSKDTPLSYPAFHQNFKKALQETGIQTLYTPHDCRHTFSSLLNDANVPEILHTRLMGHSGKTLDDKVYIHKTLEQLREAIELIP